MDAPVAPLRRSTRVRKAPQRFRETEFAFDFLVAHLKDAAESSSTKEDYVATMISYYRPSIMKPVQLKKLAQDMSRKLGAPLELCRDAMYQLAEREGAASFLQMLEKYVDVREVENVVDDDSTNNPAEHDGQRAEEDEEYELNQDEEEDEEYELGDEEEEYDLGDEDNEDEVTRMSINHFHD